MSINEKVSAVAENSCRGSVNPSGSGEEQAGSTTMERRLDVTFHPRVGALTGGGKPQQLAPANASRKYIIIQNPGTGAGQNLSTAESLFIRFGLNAGVNDGTSFEILPGSCMEFDAVVSTEFVSVNAATAGHRWIAVEA